MRWWWTDNSLLCRQLPEQITTGSEIGSLVVGLGEEELTRVQCGGGGGKLISCARASRFRYMLWSLLFGGYRVCAGIHLWPCMVGGGKELCFQFLKTWCLVCGVE